MIFVGAFRILFKATIIRTKASGRYVLLRLTVDRFPKHFDLDQNYSDSVHLQSS